MTRFAIALALILALALPAAAADDRRILLQTSFANAKEKKERSPKPKRSRFIEPDFAALEAPPLEKNEKVKLKRKLTAALFDDHVVHIELEDIERNGVDAYVWSGKIEGDPASSVTMVVKGQALVATISTLTERWMIEPTEEGAHEVFELDLAAFPNEQDPMRVTTDSAVSSDVPVASDSAAFFDILVVYSDDLRVSLGSTAAAQAAASNAIAATNIAFQNSGVTPRVRLAGTGEMAHDDNGNMGAALPALRSTTDGVMDTVHALRDQVGADAVALLVLNGGGSCGVAYVMTSSYVTGASPPSFAASAFGVVANNCAVGNLSFPHELGHNFGLQHDRYVATGTAAYPYGFGFVDVNYQFRDVMAYVNACGSCPRIQYFSNPNITYLNRPLGISYTSSPSTSADNVLALNNAASVIANWRQAVVSPYTPATFTDNPLIARTTPVKLLHITELRTAINNYRASVGLSAATWTAIGTGTTISAAHITQMRTALTAAIPAAVYTDTLSSTIAIKAVHIQELRNYLD